MGHSQEYSSRDAVNGKVSYVGEATHSTRFYIFSGLIFLTLLTLSLVYLTCPPADAWNASKYNEHIVPFGNKVIWNLVDTPSAQDALFNELFIDDSST